MEGYGGFPPVPWFFRGVPAQVRIGCALGGAANPGCGMGFESPIGPPSVGRCALPAVNAGAGWGGPDRPLDVLSVGADSMPRVRPLCALVVAGVAACASYVHQRKFALQGGADSVSASLWPLCVDGLVRHEALGDRAEVEGLRRRVVAAAWLKLGAG